jgi:hypothetical protein
LVVGVKFRESFLVGEIATFAMSNRNAQKFVSRDLAGERGVTRDGLEENMLTTKLEGAVADQRAGEQAGFTQDLKPVAYAKHKPTIGREGLNRFHYRTEPGDGAGPQIIAITEAARDDYGIGSSQGVVFVPNQPSGVPHDIAQDMNRILVTVRGWKLEDGEVHFTLFQSDNLQ